jgi:hypothetical protein
MARTAVQQRFSNYFRPRLTMDDQTASDAPGMELATRSLLTRRSNAITPSGSSPPSVMMLPAATPAVADENWRYRTISEHPAIRPDQANIHLPRLVPGSYARMVVLTSAPLWKMSSRLLMVARPRRTTTASPIGDSSARIRGTPSTLG